MAKAVRSAPGPARRAPVAPGGGGGDRTGYLRGVWEELKKVIWPTPSELWRMTGIVIATVFIFAALIGAADYGLGIAVKQIYSTNGAPAKTSPTPAPANTSGAPIPSAPAQTAP